MRKSVSVLMSAFFIIVFHISISAGATVTVSVSVDGGAVNSSVTGSFTTCKTCDAYGNCTVNNSGTVTLYLDNGSLCAASGSGSASCASAPLDRGGLNGTHVFTGYASDCTGIRASTTYNLQLDNTPSISIGNPPAGTIAGPFDVTATAQFKPTLNPTKGSILCYGPNAANYGGVSCTTESCSYSYQQWYGKLLQFNTGDYSITCRASGGGAFGYDTHAFHVDQTPTIKIINPNNGASLHSPFDIQAIAQFKPSLSSPWGSILCYGPNGVNYGGANCSTENCSYSYQQSAGKLLNPVPGSYTVTCRATAGGMFVYDTINFSVDGSADIMPRNDTGSSDSCNH